MPDRKVHVSRDGLTLGDWPLTEVHELLAGGFLRLTDRFRIDGQTDWLPLSGLPPAGEPATTSAVTKIASAVTGAAGAIRQGATRALTRVTTAAGQQREHMNQATNRLLEDYLIPLRALVQSALTQTSHTFESALRDEVFMRKLFGAVYDCLPRPVTRFVTEEAFIQFCLKHRQRLLSE